MFTPSGEIKSGLHDLRDRAFHQIEKPNGDILFDIFDTMIKPILLYSSDFRGCLKLPKENPINILHIMFCKQILGFQK